MWDKAMMLLDIILIHFHHHTAKFLLRDDQQQGLEFILRNKMEDPSFWNKFLLNPENFKRVAPVDSFAHAPFHDIWRDFAKAGRKMELVNVFRNEEGDGGPNYWIGTIAGFCGYKALVKYERFGEHPFTYGWISYCSSIPKSIGFADKQKLGLLPQSDICKKFPDFIAKARIVLKDCETIMEDHEEFVKNEIRRFQKFRIGELVEVLDRTNISRMRMATVSALFGDRVHVTYVIEPQPKDPGFWFSSGAELMHPVGWSSRIGHPIYGGLPVTPSPDIIEGPSFPETPTGVTLTEGSFIEARHPRKPYSICVARINEVLNHGYFVAKFITNSQEVKKPTLFSFHVTSPYVFHVGFCDKHGIEKLSYIGEKKTGEVCTNSAPLRSLANRPPHKFQIGHKMETVDVLDPAALYPVTVAKVAGHLLRLYYDGWSRADATSYVWMDAASSEIYPLGYCEMVGLKLRAEAEEVSI